MKKIILGITTPIITIGTTASVLACSVSSKGDEIPVLKNYSSETIKGGFHSQSRPSGASKIDITKDKIAFVSDGNDLEDYGFNQSILTGLQEARGVPASNIFTNHVFNPKTDDIAGLKGAYKDAMINNDLIVAAGFKHLGILGEIAKNNPTKRFVLLDGHVTVGAKKELPWNVLAIEFDVAAPSFLMGVIAAKEAQKIDPIDPVVGVFAAMKINTITPYLNSFKNGVAYFDKNLMEKDSKPVLIDDQGFTGSFRQTEMSKKKAEYLATNGSDVILSIGGALYRDTLRQIQKIKGGKTRMIGADTIIGAKAIDGGDAVTALMEKQFVLGSIHKNLKIKTKEAITNILDSLADNKFGELEIENMKNNGTTILFNGVSQLTGINIKKEIKKMFGSSISTKQVKDLYNYAINTK